MNSITKAQSHRWHFIQTGGLVQVKISTIDDLLHLDELDPKLWIALACPVKGLEFSEETLSLLDTDKNGRVRVPEILEAVSFVKKYFAKPEVLMEAGSSIPLDALGKEPFDCGHSPYDSAKAVLKIIGKEDAAEITLDDVSVKDKLFSPSVFNGDKILPPEAAKDELSAAVIKEIISCTGGDDDISGSKGITRKQKEEFFDSLRAVKEWRNGAQENAPQIFFLKYQTDAAAESYMAVRDKVNEYFLRCSLECYNTEVELSLRKKEEDTVLSKEVLCKEELSKLPLAVCKDGKKELPLGREINPAWKDAVDAFRKNTVEAILGEGKKSITEDEWNKIQQGFEPYMDWYDARPQNCAKDLSFERIDEILASDAETLITSYLDDEEKHPPISLATLELRKMILYRRDMLELVKNFVSFENFYSPDDDAVFQCGTLYIDGRSCDLCFRVMDAAKHASMSPLSQCYLLYCDCTNASGEKMQIAAMVSQGSRDNFIPGRNGVFFDRKGQDWDATIVKIIENPISIKEGFFSPYKKLVRMIQDRIAKTAASAESSVAEKMSAAVEKPTDAATAAKEATAGKKIDVGTIAAISVAFTGIATVVGGLLQAFLGLGWWIPLGIVGLILIISVPSMFIAWAKLKQRNIAPILDASGWAVNGNVKINIPLGSMLTVTAVRPKGSKLDSFDPYRQKGFPVKRTILALVLIAMIVLSVVIIAKNDWNFFKAVGSVKDFFVNFVKMPEIKEVAVTEVQQ